jgi:hypothetical protein
MAVNAVVQASSQRSFTMASPPATGDRDRVDNGLPRAG